MKARSDSRGCWAGGAPQGWDCREGPGLGGVGLSLGCGSQENQDHWYPKEGGSSKQKETGQTARGGGNM